MCACWIWQVLCVFCCVTLTLCTATDEYEVVYPDNYGNDITQEHEQGESTASPCQGAELTHWDKLFVNLEDSAMRQNMLLEVQEKCCIGTASFRSHIEKLAKGTCHQYSTTLESVCRGQMEQASLRLQRGLSELRQEGAEREWRLNTTLQHLLRGVQEQNARVQRLEERVVQQGTQSNGSQLPGERQEETVPDQGETLSEIRPAVTRPGGLGAGQDFGDNLLSSGMKEQQVASQLDIDNLARVLANIAAELQKVQVQLNRLVGGKNERGNSMRRDKEIDY